jgi:hypothetical protein
MAAIPAANRSLHSWSSSRRRGLAKRDIGIRLCDVYGNTAIYPGKQRALVLHRCPTPAQWQGIAGHRRTAYVAASSSLPRHRIEPDNAPRRTDHVVAGPKPPLKLTLVPPTRRQAVLLGEPVSVNPSKNIGCGNGFSCAAFARHPHCANGANGPPRWPQRRQTAPVEQPLLQQEVHSGQGLGHRRSQPRHAVVPPCRPLRSRRS